MNSKRIKILMVLNDLRNGGTEAFVMNYFRYIDHIKFGIDFLVLSGKEEFYKEEIEKLGGRIIHISIDNKKEFFRNIIKTKNIIKKQKYDIVHIHACSLKFMLQVILATKLAMVKSCKIIGHAHSIGEPKGTYLDRVIRFILRHFISNLIHYAMSCSTDAAEEKYSRSLLESKRYCIIPNAIDTTLYAYNIDKRKEIRSKYKIGDELVLGIVGRLEKWKNQTFLIDVLADLIKIRKAYLIIIGDGEIKKDLCVQVEKLGLRDNVLFTGQISNTNDFYSAMDVFTLPSFAEGFPFVLVEAQANGLKCLVSDEITKETNISGTVEFMPINDSQVWAKRISEIGLDRIDDKKRMRVIEKYNLKNAVKFLEEKYMEIAK